MAHRFSSSNSTSFTNCPPRTTGGPSPLLSTFYSDFCSPFLMSISSSCIICSYLFIKLISLGVLFCSSFYHTPSLSFMNSARPLSLNASVFWNREPRVSYLLFSSDSYCFMPMDRLTRIPIIGAKYYSKVAE